MAPFAAKINLRERHFRGGLKTVWVCFVNPPQIFVRRFGELRCVLHEEFEFLRQAAAHNEVVLIEAHRARFLGEQFLFQIFCHQAAQFLSRRRALLLAHPRVREPRDVVAGDMHRACAIPASGRAGIKPRVSAENQRAKREEVKQRFSDYALQGVYQMGEV